MGIIINQSFKRNRFPCSSQNPLNPSPPVKKILVVEDHKDTCLWIVAVLRQCGFQAMEAGDGALAVRMAHKERPDLILLDLHLPAGGGEFVMESLQGDPTTSVIPIVIMTGDPDVDRVHMRSKGAKAVFCKPMDVHVFLNTIRSALEANELPANGTIPLRGAGLEVSGSKRDVLTA
jgi:DNA-binding response OmpR family regulator